MKDKLTGNSLSKVSSRTVAIKDDVVSSRELFGPLQKLWIKHEAEQYELRVTKQGKLILTK